MRVGPTVLIAIAMLVAPAASAAAQPSLEEPTLDDPGSGEESGEDDYDAVIVHETDDHYVVEVTVPTSMYDRNHEAYFSVPVSEDRVSGGASAGDGDGQYKLVVSIEPGKSESGSISLEDAGWDSEVTLEEHPESPLPVLAEQTDNKLDDQLDEVEQKMRALMDDTEEMRALLEELRQDTADTGTAEEQPLAENATELIDQRLEFAFELLLQSEAWLTEPVRETSGAAAEEIERHAVVDATFQLVYILLVTSQQILEDNLPGDGDLEVESPDELDDEIADLNQTLHDWIAELSGWYQEEVRDLLFYNVWDQYNATDEQVDEAFRTVHQITDEDDDDPCEEDEETEEEECPPPCPEGEERNEEGECEPECPEDEPTACPVTFAEKLVLEASRTLLKTVEENYTETERTVLDRVGSASLRALTERLPENYPEEETRGTYDDLEQNYSELLGSDEEEGLGAWQDERVEKTFESIHAVDEILRYVVEDWFQNYPGSDQHHGLDEDLRKMLDASRAQLNESEAHLNALTPDGGDEEGEDDEQDEQEEDDKTLVQQAWTATNRSRENVTEAIHAIEELVYTERPVEKAFQEVTERMDRPTQIRVLVPKEVPEPNEPDPEVTDVGDLVPEDEDEVEDTLQEETPGEGPETPEAPPTPEDEEDAQDPLGEDDSSGSSDDGDDSSDDGSDESESSEDDADEQADEGDQGSDAADEGGSEDGPGAEGEDGGSDDQGSSDDGSQAHPDTDVVLQPDRLELREGEQTVASVEVRNNGDEQQTYHVTAEEDGPATVDAPEEASATLEPGEVATLRTRVNPTGPGEGVLTYHLSGQTTSTHEVPFEVQAASDAEEALSVKTSPWHLSMDPDESRTVVTTVENTDQELHAVSVDAWGDGPVSASVGGPGEVELEPGEEATFEVTVTPQADGLGEVTTRVSAGNGDAVEPIVLVKAGDAPGFSGVFPSAGDAEDAQGSEDDERGLPLPAAVGLVALIGAALARRKHT